MYNLVNDPLEKTNVAGKPEYLEKFLELHAQLIEQMVKLKTVPGRFSIYTEEMKQQNFGSSVCVMQWTGVIRDGTLIEKGI